LHPQPKQEEEAEWEGESTSWKAAVAGAVPSSCGSVGYY
jgi:hypothetical protein